MKRLWLRLFLPALALVAFAPAAQAQVMIRTPGVQVQVGRPIVVQTPGVRVVVPPGVPVPPPPLPPAPPPVPLEGAPVVPVPRVMTPAEFAAGFKVPKCGGAFSVVLQHPYTCQPVKVCFCLPRGGCFRKARFVKGCLELRYRLCKAVVVRFCPDGGVRVFD